MTDPALSMTVGWIATYEGFRADPYPDSGGVWTIGFGETYNLDGSRVTAATPPITRADAMTRLSVVVSAYLEQVRYMVHVPITNHQAAALSSICYNVGTNAIRNSSLLLALNKGATAEAADKFCEWVYDDRRVIPGLVQRRKTERELFLTPDIPPPAAAVDADDLNAR